MGIHNIYAIASNNCGDVATRSYLHYISVFGSCLSPWQMEFFLAMIINHPANDLAITKPASSESQPIRLHLLHVYYYRSFDGEKFDRSGSRAQG